MHARKTAFQTNIRNYTQEWNIEINIPIYFFERNNASIVQIPQIKGKIFVNVKVFVLAQYR